MRGMLQSALSAVTTKPALITHSRTGASCNEFDPALFSDLKPFSSPGGRDTRPSTSPTSKRQILLQTKADEHGGQYEITAHSITALPTHCVAYTHLHPGPLLLPATSHTATETFTERCCEGDYCIKHFINQFEA